MSLDLSLENRAREKAFQDHIIEQLAASGWLVGESAHYDKERALYPEDVIAYVQESQPEGWQKFDPLRAMSGAPCGYFVIR